MIVQRSPYESDRRHRVTISGVYHLPFGRDRRFLRNAIRVVDGARRRLGSGRHVAVQQRPSVGPAGQRVLREGRHAFRTSTTAPESIRGVQNCVAQMSDAGVVTMLGFSVAAGCTEPNFIIRPNYTARTTEFRDDEIRRPPFYQFDINFAKTTRLAEQRAAAGPPRAVQRAEPGRLRRAATTRTTRPTPLFGTIDRAVDSAVELPALRTAGDQAAVLTLVAGLKSRDHASDEHAIDRDGPILLCARSRRRDCAALGHGRAQPQDRLRGPAARDPCALHRRRDRRSGLPRLRRGSRTRNGSARRRGRSRACHLLRAAVTRVYRSPAHRAGAEREAVRGASASRRPRAAARESRVCARRRLAFGRACARGRSAALAAAALKGRAPRVCQRDCRGERHDVARRVVPGLRARGPVPLPEGSRLRAGRPRDCGAVSDASAQRGHAGRCRLWRLHRSGRRARARSVTADPARADRSAPAWIWRPEQT